MRRTLPALAALLAACSSTTGTPEASAPLVADAPEVTEASDIITAPDVTAVDAEPPDTTPAPPAPEWLAPPAPACALDAGSPLLDEALALGGLTLDTFTFGEADYEQSGYYQGGHLDDPFLLSWFRETQAAPARAGCFGAEAAGTLDALAAGPHPVADAIRHAAKLIERWEEGPPVTAAPATLEAAIAACCEAAGMTCDAVDIALPDDLKTALLPVFHAMAGVFAARAAMAATSTTLSPLYWIKNGGAGIVRTSSFAPVTNPSARAYLLGKDTRPALNLAAARLAWAIESVDWTPWRGVTGVTLDVATPLGWIRVRDAAVDTYPASNDNVWLLLDLGGSDVHLDDVAANTLTSQGVNVAIDLDGADQYGYAPQPAEGDPEWLLPADEDGRYKPTENDGPVTRSAHARQGAGRNGVAMLFDLGGASDTYRSLAQSQGYAHLGVGVLFDDGGSDTYEAETASQGAAAYGIGLLIDLGDGDDVHRIVTAGQGSSVQGGIGVAYDAGGNDTWYADPGEDYGGHALYYSPQMPGKGNTSMSQGASTGLRYDAAQIFFSGGVGILRDVKGDDHYTASLFAQGSGYWQGTGILSDGGGEDTYDALYYVQGGAAHYAMGLLLDGGPGGDKFNVTTTYPQYMQMGAGHDFSLGVLVNDQGDDVYAFGGLAMGASNCNGIGLVIDNAGDDLYETSSDYNSGLGNVSGECAAARPKAVSIGVMIDAGGADTYAYPAESAFKLPANDATWGHVTHDLPSEHGAGLDGSGETGVHAP